MKLTAVALATIVMAQTRPDLTRATGSPGLTAETISATVLRVGGGCSPSTPCNVGFGRTALSVVRSVTLTLTSSSKGAVAISLDQYGAFRATPSGAITFTCSVCTIGPVAPGVFVYPLAVWNAEGGRWTVGLDSRPHVAYCEGPIEPGVGIRVDRGPTGVRISIDPAYFAAIPPIP